MEMTFGNLLEQLEKKNSNFSESVNAFQTFAGAAACLIGDSATGGIFALLKAIDEKEKLLDLGKALLDKITGEKPDDYIGIETQMRVAYGTLFFTAFFDELNDRLPKEIRRKIQLTSEEKQSLTAQLNVTERANRVNEIPLSFLDSFYGSAKAEEDLKKLYRSMAQRLLDFISKTSFSETADEREQSILRGVIEELPTAAVSRFNDQFLTLCEKIPAFRTYTNTKRIAALYDEIRSYRAISTVSSGIGTTAALHRASVVTANIPAGPSPSFVGRADRMSEIETAFRDGHTVVDLYGMGGIGKSEICRYLFQKYMNTGTNIATQIGWVTWQGTLKDTFYAQFRDIWEDNTERYWERARDFMHTTGKDLLIFLDNADTLPDAWELTRMGCEFLVTSRRKQYHAYTIATGTLPIEQCRILYRRALNNNDELTDDSPEETLDEILRLAAGHTLTVKLLARTQRAAQLTTGGLLAKLNESGFDLTGIGEEIYYSHYKERDDNSGGYLKFIEHTSRIFDLSTLRNDMRDTASLRALQGMSLLAPNVYIPMKTAQKWLKLPNLNGLNRAAELGWLNTRMESGGMQFVSIHPVVATVVRHTEPPCTELIDTVSGQLYRDMVVGTTEIFTEKLPIVEHAMALVEAEKYLHTTNYGMMTVQIGYLLHCRGEFSNALFYLKNGLKILIEERGEECEETAIAYTDIGNVYRALGKFSEALEQHKKALRIREKILDTDHPDIAWSCGKIGLVYKSMGEHDNSLEWHKRALQIREKTLGMDHPFTAFSYNHIGFALFKRGDYSNALKLFKKALDIKEKTLGPYHPKTSSTYHYLGMLYFEQGDYGEALKWFEKALDVRKNVLGNNHPRTKDTQKWLADVKRRLFGEE